MLPSLTQIGNVQLRVRNIERSLSFYNNLLGFQHQFQRAGTSVLYSSVPEKPLLTLYEDTNAQPKPPRTTGLYHVAIRLPDRKGLGILLARIIEHGYPLIGAADHLVSEAIYLNDPEGNGLELYCDRDRTEWRMQAGQITMSTDPLDLKRLIEEATRDSKPWIGIPATTDIGHIHLSVSNLKLSEDFYHGILGLDVTQRSYPGALFLSAGGYHHHIGLNIWSSRDAPPPPPDSSGLVSFDLIVGDLAAQHEILTRLNQSNTKINSIIEAGFSDNLNAVDPDGIQVNIR